MLPRTGTWSVVRLRLKLTLLWLPHFPLTDTVSINSVTFCQNTSLKKEEEERLTVYIYQVDIKNWEKGFEKQ